MGKYKQLYPTDMGFDKIRQLELNWENNFKELRRIDKEAQDNGTLLHRYFSTPVADGRAYYQVTKLNKTSCVLTRCPGICPDEYEDNILGEQSTMPLKKVEDFVNRQQAINRLFGG
jgi:hypothetical protein